MDWVRKGISDRGAPLKKTPEKELVTQMCATGAKQMRQG